MKKNLSNGFQDTLCSVILPSIGHFKEIGTHGEKSGLIQ